MRAYFKYDIATGDTAFAGLVMKKNGNIIYEEMFPITGNSSGAFVPLSFKINYSGPDVPDTIIPAFGNSTVGNPASILTFDKLTFAGTSQNVSNADFENWIFVPIEHCNYWYPGTDPFLFYQNEFLPPYQKSSDSYTGRYAMQINSCKGFDNHGFTVSCLKQQNEHHPISFPLYHNPHALNGYYKYFPTAHDTILIRVNLFYHGGPVCSAQFAAQDSVTTYKAFSIPINYTGPVDSGGLSIKVGTLPMNGNATLLIDALTFDGFAGASTVVTTMNGTITSDSSYASLSIWPNPVRKTLYMMPKRIKNSRAEFQVYDIRGQLMNKFSVYMKEGETIPLNVSDYPKGMYLLVFRNQYRQMKGKFIKQ